jgi:hypothetical protein
VVSDNPREQLQEIQPMRDWVDAVAELKRGYAVWSGYYPDARPYSPKLTGTPVGRIEALRDAEHHC